MTRFHRRTLVGGLMAVLAAVMVVIITRPSPTTNVLVADADLSAGIPLGAQRVTVRATSTPEGLVVADDPASFGEWSLTAPLDAGEPIPASLLAPEPRRLNPDVVAVSLDGDHAVGGFLRPGDLVDVYVTASDDEGRRVTEAVAESVYIVDVADDSSGFAQSGSFHLLLAADGPLAAILVHALRTGDVDLVRVGR